MRAVLRSVVPAVLIIAAVVYAAYLVAPPAIVPASGWQPPDGYRQVSSLELQDDVSLVLWSGRVGPPKPSDCMYLEFREKGQAGAFGGCGDYSQPWLQRYPGAIFGGVGDRGAVWVRVADGDLVPVRNGVFMTPGSVNTEAASLELLDAGYGRMAYLPAVPVGGTPVQ